MERVISLTDLVRNAARIAKDVETKGTVYRITRGGRGSMVLVDNEYFDGWMAAIDEMRRPGWREALTEARHDAQAGRGRDLEVIAKELALDRPSQPKSQSPLAALPAPAARKLVEALRVLGGVPHSDHLRATATTNDPRDER